MNNTMEVQPAATIKYTIYIYIYMFFLIYQVEITALQLYQFRHNSEIK